MEINQDTHFAYKTVKAEDKANLVAESIPMNRVLPLYFLASEYQGKPDGKLSGNSWDFFHLSMNNRRTDSNLSFDSNIHFEGDAATGQ